ncbi:unnamed protein product, partial [Brassica rapa subsp. trilocularis]
SRFWVHGAFRLSPFRIAPVFVVVVWRRWVSARPGLLVVICCRSCVSCLFGEGGGYLGFLRVGVIPVATRFLHSLFEMEARLKADVIVVKVSGLMPCARASGYASTGRLWP